MTETHLKSVSPWIRCFVLSLIITSFLGCGLSKQVFKIAPDPILNCTSAPKLDLVVELRLTDTFRTFTWDAPTGLPYTLELGDALYRNAELLGNNAFKETVITDGSVDSSADVDAVLIPEVVFLDKTQAAYGFQEVEMEIHVKWTLTDTHGKTLWVDTIAGKGREKMGGPISFEKNTRKQIRMAMGDMFNNTYRTLMTAAGYLNNFAHR